jgi:glycosyltransferase involved in cell wall biosynthesis
MAMVEALACGTPVVGCALGAAPEIVEHGVTGFLGTTDDELIAGVRSLDRIERRACREEVGRRCSVEQMVDGYLRVYQRSRSSTRSATPITAGS